MNLNIAISAFNDFRLEIDELESIDNRTEHQIDAIHKRCQALINTFYGDNKWVNTFQKDIEVLIVDKDNDSFDERIHRLRLLVENIRQDLYLKQRLEDEAKQIVEDEKQKKIDEYLGKILAHQRNEEGYAARTTRLRTQLESAKREIDTTRNTYQAKIDETKNSYQNEIDRLKQSYQDQIDALRHTIANTPRPKSFRNPFFIVLLILVSGLNLTIHYLTLHNIHWSVIGVMELIVLSGLAISYWQDLKGWTKTLLGLLIIPFLLALYFVILSKIPQ